MEDNGLVIRGVLVDATPGGETAEAHFLLLKAGAYRPVLRLTADGEMLLNTPSGWQPVLVGILSQTLIAAD